MLVQTQAERGTIAIMTRDRRGPRLGLGVILKRLYKEAYDVKAGAITIPFSNKNNLRM